MRFPRGGRFRDRVTVEKRIDGQDEYAGLPDEWENIPDTGTSPNQPEFSRRCDIQPLNGKEFFAARAEGNSISIRVRFRYSDSLAAVLKPHRRLVDKRRSPHRVLDIESVIDANNEHKELIAMCEERT